MGAVFSSRDITVLLDMKPVSQRSARVIIVDAAGVIRLFFKRRLGPARPVHNALREVPGRVVGAQHTSELGQARSASA